MYCTLASLKTYLGISTSTDDALMQILLDAASARIDSRTQRRFWSNGDGTRYYGAADILRGILYIDDIGYITSITNGDGALLPSTDYYTVPRNDAPYNAIGIRLSSTASWDTGDDYVDGIVIVGRWGYLNGFSITALSRATNVVTATVNSTVEVGQRVIVAGCADTSFNGTFTVTANSGTTVTWAQTATNDTDTTAVLLASPVPIVDACRRLAAWLYRQKDTQQSGISSPLFTADGQVVMPSTLPQDVEDILRPYMKML